MESVSGKNGKYMKGSAFFARNIMKNSVKALSCAVALIFVLSSCGKEAEQYEDRVIYGMDSYVTIRLPKGAADSETLDEIEKTCARIIEKNEKLMSSHKEDAVVYGLNRDVDSIVGANEALVSVMESALQIEELTDGAFSPTLGALTELWNVTGGGPVPDDYDILEALGHISSDALNVNGENISFDSNDGCRIDLGAIGKGYTAQELVEYLSTTDVPYGIVSVGGNVGVFGSKNSGEKYKVGISDPDDKSSAVGYIYMDSGFLSVSGDYERYFEQDGKRYHHIIDPATGRPAESGLRSAAALVPDGANADALSTAIFVMGADRALELYKSGRVRFEAVLITSDGEIILTDGLKNGEFELNSKKYSVKN